jgi:hypothetical protein
MHLAVRKNEVINNFDPFRVLLIHFFIVACFLAVDRRSDDSSLKFAKKARWKIGQTEPRLKSIDEVSELPADTHFR